MGLGDGLVGDIHRFAVLLDADGLLDDPEELPVEATTLMDERSRAELDLSTGEALEIAELNQRPVKPGGAHLEAKGPWDEVHFVLVEDGAEGPADGRAIFEADPAPHARVAHLGGPLAIDDQLHHRLVSTRAEADVDDLKPKLRADPVCEALEALGNFAVLGQKWELSKVKQGS